MTPHIRELAIGIQRRFSGPSELRLLPATNTKSIGTLSGYAATYNSQSGLLYGAFREMLAPGCFDGVLRTADCVCCINHDVNQLLGRTTSGTLRLTSDKRGLHYSCDLPDTPTARELRELVRRGDINANSFSFTPPDEDDETAEKWTRLPDGTPLRTIYRIDGLHDVSPVVHPAYPESVLTGLTTGDEESSAPRHNPRHQPGRMTVADADRRLGIMQRELVNAQFNTQAARFTIPNRRRPVNAPVTLQDANARIKMMEQQLKRVYPRR